MIFRNDCFSVYNKSEASTQPLRENKLFATREQSDVVHVDKSRSENILNFNSENSILNIRGSCVE